MLVLAMIVSLVPATIFAADSEEPIKYVSLGASNTNGYGIRGYLPGSVTEVRGSAFSGCTALRSAVIEKNAGRFRIYAFVPALLTSAAIRRMIAKQHTC